MKETVTAFVRIVMAWRAAVGITMAQENVFLDSTKTNNNIRTL
jgi:hypothetical protein